MSSFTVGAWTVNPESGRMRSGSSQIKLQPQVMDLLVYLSRHPGEVISIERMIEDVWHGKPMTSGSVYNSLNNLRKAFEDDPNKPEYIENIPRRGYRLIAEVGHYQALLEPAEKAQQKPGLLAELQRRNVIRVSVAYVIMMWLVIQVSDIVLPRIGLPDWTVTLVIVLLAIGFLPVVFVAWAYELTPEGLRPELPPGSAPSQIRHVTPMLNWLILGLMVAAVGLLTLDRFREPDATSGVTVMRNSIAVLPFDTRSDREDDEFFVEGIHDDLLTSIAGIGSLKVISRTSVMEYKDTTKKIPQIAGELGVAHVLEGGVQRSGNQVRINVQLIDAVTDEHLWAQIYDRELTAENLFAIQSEISRAIASELQTVLTPEEERRINTMPTGNLVAYDAYLRGKRLMSERSTDSLQQAVQYFRTATELDPGFALAWVGLADSLYLHSGYGGPPSSETIRERELAVDNALAIDDSLGEAYTSLATIHSYHGRDAEAEAAFKKGIEYSPNYATGHQWYSLSLQGEGRSSEAVALLSRAKVLDPRSSIITSNLASVYAGQGMYSLAERQLRDLIAIDPGFGQANARLATVYHNYTGELDKAWVEIESANKKIPDNLNVIGNLAWIYLSLGDIDAAQTTRNAMANLNGQHRWIGVLDAQIALVNQNPHAVRESVQWMLGQGESQSFVHWAAMLELAAGDPQRARELFLQNNPGWMNPEEWGELVGADNRVACAMAWVFEQTGDVDMAEQLLQQALSYVEDSLPARTEHPGARNPEICYLAAGETEKALASIELQLEHNHLGWWWFYHELPMFELIRGEPRYQVALAEHERRITVQRERVKQMRQESGN